MNPHNNNHNGHDHEPDHNVTTSLSNFDEQNVPSHFDQQAKMEIPNVPGWGHDIDTSNMPTHPMKKYTGDDHKRLNYERAEQQPLDVELLQSVERPSASRVFGNTLPPSGLSGKIRRAAFKYSEGKGQHWMLLLLADRVNVVEGVIDDLRRGHIPNIFAEKGWNAAWKYDRPKLVKVALMVGVTALTLILLSRKKRLSR